MPAFAIGDLYVPANEYVPLTLQTFGVLFTGALLGARRGIASIGLYLLLGIVGFPVFAAGRGRRPRRRASTRIADLEDGRLVLGTTGGYLIGFLVAGALVGRLAELGWDRRLRGSIAAMAIGSVDHLRHRRGLAGHRRGPQLADSRSGSASTRSCPVTSSSSSSPRACCRSAGASSPAGTTTSRSRPTAGADADPGPDTRPMTPMPPTPMAEPDGAIVTVGLGKAYGGRGPARPDPGRARCTTSRSPSGGARSSASWAPTAPASRPRSGSCWASSTRPPAARAVLGRDVVTDGLAIRAQVGYLPGGIAFYDSMTGEAVLDYLARLHGSPARRCATSSWSAWSCRGPTCAGSCATTPGACARRWASSRRCSTTRSCSSSTSPPEGLDPLMQRAFYELLDDRRRAGRTIFFSSHILSEVERVCDRVAIIRHGELVALSDIDELLARRRRHVEARLEPGRPRRRSTGWRASAAVEVTDGVLRCDLEGDVGPFLAAIAGVRITRPDHRAGAPRGGVPGVLRRGGRGAAGGGAAGAR